VLRRIAPPPPSPVQAFALKTNAKSERKQGSFCRRGKIRPVKRYPQKLLIGCGKVYGLSPQLAKIYGVLNTCLFLNHNNINNYKYLF
jgi:hypothetical protein